MKGSTSPDHESNCGFGISCDTSIMSAIGSAAQIVAGIALDGWSIMVAPFWLLASFKTLFPMLAIKILNSTFG